MKEETKQKLQQLRSEVLNSLAETTANLGEGGAEEIRTLITLAKTSGDVRFLERATHASQKLEDETERTTLLMDILGELEIALSQEAVTGEANAAERFESNVEQNNEG